MKFLDQMGREVQVSGPLLKIVSLVPSQTELLVDLGLQSNLVGVTKFCVHPKDLKKKVSVVGGTKNIRIEKIKSLAPDIIICNKEENTKEIVEVCESIAPVWVSDISSLEDAIQMIELLGDMFQKQTEALRIISSIKTAYQKFISFQINYPSLKVIYLIWQKPYMAAGKQTFIDALLKLNGFTNVITEARYPEVSDSTILKCDVVLLSSEPFPFKESHAIELEAKIKKPVLVVDGEYFSWYGSRLSKAFTYFENLQKQLSEIF